MNRRYLMQNGNCPAHRFLLGRQLLITALAHQQDAVAHIRRAKADPVRCSQPELDMASTGNDQAYRLRSAIIGFEDLGYCLRHRFIACNLGFKDMAQKGRVKTGMNSKETIHQALVGRVLQVGIFSGKVPRSSAGKASRPDFPIAWITSLGAFRPTIRAPPSCAASNRGR